MQHYDLIIKNGLVFDGLGNKPQHADVAIKNGIVAKIDANGIDSDAAHIIDAQGQWVTPGFIDLHTHYDVELMVAPSLSESVRHGVTTCFIGSCSISMIFSATEDASDIFTRVESIPREQVLPILHKTKTWSDAKGYVAYLTQHSMGPNIASYAGHSDLRVAVLGLDRAVDPKDKPTKAEMHTMQGLLQEALDEGLLGFSSMTNPWDKVDGDRQRSAALPSVYARWSEYRAFHKQLREQDAILQSAPNLTTKINALFFLFTSASLFVRRSLRTTLITLMDPKTDPMLSRLAGFGANLFNKLLRSNFRWQALPSPFQVYSDGIDFIIFEEFPTGEMALHLEQDFERNKLFEDSSYRARFKKDYRRRFGGKVWHRDFNDAWIMQCPDESVVGKSIGEVAKQRGQHEVDAFLDLLIDHGRALRWRTTIANHRPQQVRRNISQACALIGFSDAGAHLRNMAFYNFPLHMLQWSLKPNSQISPEFAVYRLTGEIAQWYSIDAGVLQQGRRADIAIVDPVALEQENLDSYAEAPFKELGGLMRVVNRNDKVVKATIINGRLAWNGEKFSEDLGSSTGYGQFLRRNLSDPV